MKITKNILLIGFFGFLLYNSIYIENLKKQQTTKERKDFNPATYTQKLFNKNRSRLFYEAIDFSGLLRQLKGNREAVFKKYGHSNGISNSYYFLIKAGGTIDSTSGDLGYAVIDLSGMKNAQVHLKNSVIFGNAIINATDWVNVNDFSSMMDFDNISNALNKLIVKNIKSVLASKSNIGKKITFVGAMKFEKNEHVNLSDLPEITPIEVKILQ